MSKKAHIFKAIYGLFGLIFLSACALYYFLFIPNPYLTPYVLEWINQQGWGRFQVEKIALHPTEIHLENLTYSPADGIPPLSINAANLTLSWDGFSPEVQEVVVKDLTLSKETIEKLLSVPSTGVYQIPPITFENTIVESEDAVFPFKLVFNGRLNHEKIQNGKFEITIPQGTLAGDLEATLLPHLDAHYSNIKVTLNDFPNLHLVGEGSKVFRDNKVKADFNFTEPNLSAKIQCDYQLDKDNGACVINAVSDKIETLAPKEILETYKITDLKGALKGNLKIPFQNLQIQPSNGAVSFLKTSFTHPVVKIENLSTALQFVLNPAISFPKQTLKIAIGKADVGVPLSQIQMNLNWDGKESYHLLEALARLDQGQVTTKNVKFTLPFESIRMPLNFNHVPAQYFVTLSQVSNLTVTGHVVGLLDVEFTPQEYAIHSGSTLKIEEDSGTIQYRPGSEPKQIKTLTGDENPMDLVFLALWNFQYQKLSLDLEKPLDKGLASTLHVKGRNPNLLGGHEFEFNIKATGQLKELIENLFESIRSI